MWGRGRRGEDLPIATVIDVGSSLKKRIVFLMINKKKKERERRKEERNLIFQKVLQQINRVEEKRRDFF